MIRVFIVADVRLYRESLVEALTAAPATEVVGMAGDAAAALAAVRATPPDVILLDTAMPDSLAVLRRLAAGVPVSRVIAVALPDRPEDVLACAEAGIAGYLPRGASTADLLATIEGVALGEMACSPQIGASLLRRVGSLAAGSAPPPVSLTRRETEVLELIDQGLTNKEIAVRLFIETSTVKNHVHNILDKLGVTRRSDAVRHLRASMPLEAVAHAGPAPPNGHLGAAAPRAELFGRRAGVIAEDAGHAGAASGRESFDGSAPAGSEPTPSAAPQPVDERWWARLRRAMAPSGPVVAFAPARRLSSPGVGGDADPPALAAHLLGPLRLAFNGDPVEGWPSEHIPSRRPAAVEKWAALRAEAGLT